MKLRYLTSAIAALALIVTGCSQKAEIGPDNGNVSVESSYVAIAAEGGSATMTLEASDAWSIVTDLSSYEWLTVTPTSGSAGTTTINFTATETSSTRSAKLQIKVGDNYEYIVVGQDAAADATIYSVSDALKLDPGKIITVTGVCTSVASTTYGNWYLTDPDTGEQLYIYGTYNANGQYPKDATGGWSSFGIDVGDVVTVTGPLTLYGTVWELVDVEIVSIVKSLVSADPKEFTFPYTGGTENVVISYSGDDLKFESDVDWLTVQSITENDDETTMVIVVAENPNSEERTGTLTLSSANSSASSEVTITVTQYGAPIESSYTYTLVDEVTSGKPYLIAATDGTNYFVMEPLAEAKSYGYPTVKTMTAVDGVISMEDRSSEFVLTYVEDEEGYTMYGTDNRYYYQSGTYKSAQASAELTDEAYWTITANGDGTFKINSTNDFWLQYSESYTSYGVYSSENGLMPCLLEYTGTYEYELVTSADDLTDGNYLIAAVVDGSAMVMETLEQSNISKTYGYVKGLACTPVDNVITMENGDYAFTLTSTDEGYTMLGSDGNYYYQSGTYKSFQTGEPDSYWSFELQDDGTFKMLSTNGYWAQYDSGYSSYGVYNEDKGTYPCLYKEKK